MKLVLPSLVAALASVAHSASLLQQVVVPINSFNVTNLYANSVPHSSFAYIDFDVSYTNILPATHCQARIVSYQAIGNLSDTGCDVKAIAFNLTRTGDRRGMLAIHWYFATPGQMDGVYVIPTEQFQFKGENTGVLEVYVGPQAFNIGNVSVVRSHLGNV